MRRKLTICAVFTALCVFTVLAAAQTKPAFEVASIRPAAPLDQAKAAAAVRGGGKAPTGASIDARRAEYTYMDLQSLIALAAGLKPYQIIGPAWLGSTRFDIVAKLPEGATKSDAPAMLQSLLEERFGLAGHPASVETPVIALVVGKAGPKLKAAAQTPIPIDDSTPLKPGEMKSDGPFGPVRMIFDQVDNTVVMDYGIKGKMARRDNPATHTIHIVFTSATMGLLADVVNQIMQLGGERRRVVDLTNLSGAWDFVVDVTLAISTPSPETGGPAVASDPSGASSSMTEAMQNLGLRLEARKTMLDQLIIDHVEKTPTGN